MDFVSTFAKGDETAQFSPGPPNRKPKDMKNWIVLEKTGFKESREGLGVWIQGGSAWKIYAHYERTFDTVVADLNKARNAKPEPLPLVPLEKISTDKDPGPTKGDVKSPKEAETTSYGFAVRTKYLSPPWVFFSAQKNGVTLFGKELDKIKDKKILTTIKDGLLIAEQINLTDPQGFINPSRNYENIQFMDIHTGTSSGAVGELLGEVNRRLKALG